MKSTLFITCLLLAIALNAHAQQFNGLDKSPMDMAYYPDNFPHDRKGDDQAYIRVTYSRPAKNDRAIFGKLIPFDKMWRVGANEAPEIKFYKDVTISGKKIKAGVYSLLAIPGEKEWTIVINSGLDYWGTANYKETNDVVRAVVPVKTTSTSVENFTIQFFKAASSGALLTLAWDHTMVEVPIAF